MVITFVQTHLKTIYIYYFLLMTLESQQWEMKFQPQVMEMFALSQIILVKFGDAVLTGFGSTRLTQRQR